MSGFNHCVVLFSVFSCSYRSAVTGYLQCKNEVYDFSRSLQHGKPYKTQCPPAFLELVYCAIVSFFLVLCVLFTTISLTSYITQIHRELAPLSLDCLHFPFQSSPSRGICAQRARSQSQGGSDESQPMSVTLSFT